MQNEAFYYIRRKTRKYVPLCFRFAVMSVTILTANLLTTMISNYLVSYRSDIKPLSFTLIAMGIIVVILYPLFARLEAWVKGLSIRVVKRAGPLEASMRVLLLPMLPAFFILCYFYARMWYKHRPFQGHPEGSGRCFFLGLCLNQIPIIISLVGELHQAEA